MVPLLAAICNPGMRTFKLPPLTQVQVEPERDCVAGAICVDSESQRGRPRLQVYVVKVKGRDGHGGAQRAPAAHVGQVDLLVVCERRRDGGTV